MKRVFLISLSGLLAASGWAASNAMSSPTALELLDKFAANLEPVKSFVASYEENAQTDFPNASPPIKGGSTSLGDVRVDFPRVAESSRDWGAFGGTKTQPRYSSLLTDGHLVLFYDQQSDAGSAMVMSRYHPPTGVTCVAEAMGRSGSLRACFGVLLGDSPQRFDRKIRHETTLRVRQRLELAGWTPTPCYVLDAETQTGDYTVWLDPSRGYNIARALLHQHFGHLRPNGQPFEKGESNMWMVEKVRWEQRQGVWVPVEAAGGQVQTMPGRSTARRSWHFALSLFVLNPDHTALRSFVPDDIRDGAKFTLAGARGSDVRGTWQKGRAVDAKGNVFWTPESLSRMATNKPPESGQSGGAGEPTAAARIAVPPGSPKSTTPQPEVLAVGTVAPDFAALDVAGRTMKLSDFKNKVVVLDFWATWCGPCMKSLPHAQEVANLYKNQDVIVLANCTSDTRATFEKWIKENQSKYSDISFACDPNERGSATYGERASIKLYGVSLIPTQFVIGKDGKVVAALVGYSEGDVRLEAALAKAGIQVDAATVAKGEAQMQELAPPTAATKLLRDQLLRGSAAKGEEGGQLGGTDKPNSAGKK
jgi:thiol-disulfide isomerase/thioredoxin